MIVSIVVGTAALVWGYSAAGLDSPARWLAAVGAAWLFALWQRAHWVGSLVLLVFVAAAAVGLWIGLPISLMTLGAVGGLLGWDMADFTRRLHLASATDDVRGMELRHMARVAIVSAIGLGIAGITALVRIKIPFELAVLLVLLAVIGLTRLVVWLQRGSE
jgi:hypothetical protein